MNGFTTPASCSKCGGTMTEGLTVINSERVKLTEGHPAFGNRVSLGGSCSWWAVAAPEKAGIADKVLTGSSYQVFAYRCDQCGFLELFAP